ncbi:helix-turn-helix transcriptional regulator [Shouchella clausii]|uniref:helix-turn-helix domain-containing protein n=1 Tax=Shouchella TaxID=2893057 RepID=UPI0004E658AA|nr:MULTISPECIES: helix-turn-helix transcriptional regulator [Shouchella]ALA55029.1 hypothetical protein DB29_04201 [Shouchella clausii]MBU3231002.1 helix-turn-helix domain-containing protein [Shouchella clausii]MBU3262923.1 helix-turn-helix domain-containing protein [Shouchella clausii]MBU3505388.1 helix-turn-helix domain-containing protein [Shouchella clausii]MBU3534405.1 helix-turn-helix domain-containing protein [Shouchella clausii]
MANTLSQTRLYHASQIGDVLRIARERASKPEHRTKQRMAEELGITVARLTRIEEGTAQVPLELAIQWCQIVNDHTALAKVRHIWGLDLPATNPLLQEDMLSQLINFRRQATQAIEAIAGLLDISVQLRPGDNVTERFGKELYEHAEEILDMKQATESLLTSLSLNWGLDREKLRRSWTQEALADGVLVTSVSHYEEIKKEQFFSERAASL